MSRIRFYIWLAIVGCTMCAGCHTGGDDIYPMLVCQLGVPKSISPNPKTTRVSLATCTGEDSHYLWGYNQKEQKEEGSVLIFEPDEFLLTAEPASRRALIIDDCSSPEQVFRLSLPRNPKARDWSQWQRPDFLAKGDVGWAFIYNRKIQGVMTNVPSDCFELRYRVEMSNLGTGDVTIKGRKGDAAK
jgi:hypothetical protein